MFDRYPAAEKKKIKISKAPAEIGGSFAFEEMGGNDAAAVCGRPRSQSGYSGWNTRTAAIILALGRKQVAAVSLQLDISIC